MRHLRPKGRSSAAIALALAVAVAAGVFVSSGPRAKILLARFLTTGSTPRTFDLPPLTNWKPSGPRVVSAHPAANARQVGFGRALHTDLHGSDQVGTVIAPVMTKAWDAETDMFVAEGPVFDRSGNIYFSPVFPPEDVILVALEPEQGRRLWALAGRGSGAGTPLVLEDPERGEDLVYVGTYHRAVALTTGGKRLWDVATGLPEADPGAFESEKHSFGINYHIQADALVAVMGDGHVYVLDRRSGAPLLKEPFMMPGDRTPVTNFSLPEAVSRAANSEISQMVSAAWKGEGSDPVGAVLHGAAGELQKVTNFFSIDSNTGRIWIAATLPDSEDGVVDGWSHLAALYGLDLVSSGGDYRLEVAVVAQVPGGTASTPTIRADGKRIYVADAFDTVYAIDAATGDRVWSINVGSKVTGSLAVSADNGEVYANTRTAIHKLVDRGDRAERVWTANLDMYDAGLFQENMKALGAEIAANGIAFTGAAGVVAGKQKFPLKLGAGLIDRETGEVLYYAEGAEDSVSSMVTAPDGSLYVGNSPLRRVLGRVILGQRHSPQPVLGGITRFKPVRYDLLIRDALWAAANRADNAARWVGSHPRSVQADIRQIHMLLDQAEQVRPEADAEGSLDAATQRQQAKVIQRVRGQLSADTESLTQAAKELRSLVH